ncbi:hypothetical protein KDW_29210 [Dictyobacter vulcani]|uniref:Zn-dependent protease n=1 Tax=Dictyobacter vulcani TaxID=2607529 RepID=A0A5J4KRJ5_9CHLR|nr:metallopeptidase family protein [Dictyobacter vulcani]GER88759.1 hypothetical protein KDW_29210 [Dictyobacter vulcani]
MTTPRRTEPSFPDEAVETESSNPTEIVDDPDDSPTAPLSTDYFEQLVQEALNDIPAEFEPYMANLAIFVEDEPDAELRERMNITDGHSLLGLYQGNPLTSIGHLHSLPEHITIFQKPIEAYCQGKPNRIRRQVRATVLHEIAHHFGIDHDEMPRWLK